MSNNHHEEIATRDYNDWDSELRETIEKAYGEILRCLEDRQEDPSGRSRLREGLQDTPKRVSKAWVEMFSGYWMNAQEILDRTFEEDGCDEYRGMVVEQGIQFYSHCEHHVLPFFGTVNIGYVPEAKVVGLSKLARVVDCFSKRLQVQERMTDQIADAIDMALSPKGVVVTVRALHMCMSIRGVKKQNVWTKTSSVRGCFFEDAAAREEFFWLTEGLKGVNQ